MVIVLHPAALEQCVSEVFVLALDDEDLAALHAHRFLPRLHVPALLALLGLLIRGRARGFLLLLGLLPAVAEGFQLCGGHEVKLLSEFVLPLQHC